MCRTLDNGCECHLFPDCDCRANDWEEGDNNAVRCAQCGGYSGNPGTSIRVVEVAATPGQPGDGIYFGDPAFGPEAEGEYHAEDLDERGIYGGRAYDPGPVSVTPSDTADDV